MTNEISHTPITFIIPGPPRDGASRDLTGPQSSQHLLNLSGELKASIAVGVRRAGGETHRITAVPGEDVVVLHIGNGPSLVLHPSTARDLMMAQSPKERGLSRNATGEEQLEPGPQEVEVSHTLQWHGLNATGSESQRGSPADVVLKVIEVIGLKDHLQKRAASALADAIDGRVKEGVYQLRKEVLMPLKGGATTTIQAGPAGAPSLVFIHGTFSTTSESGFGKLWSHFPGQVAALFRHYDERVYGLDHATLGRTPIENALTLVENCSKGAVLHLVTHSRGGLVAEVLSRAAALDALDDSGKTHFCGEEREQLEQLIGEMRQKDIRIERTVRVACPAHGTLLASQRLDAYLSILQWSITLAGLPVVPELVDFLGGVARERTNPQTLPGLAVMAPTSPLITWLRSAERAVPGDLRVVAGDLKADGVRSWIKSLVADAFFWTDNDLVVQTRSMYGGAPRHSGATFRLERSGESSHFNYFSNERTARAIVNGLIETSPAGWRVIGPLSYGGESSEGHREGKALKESTPQRSADKPAVIVLPGLLGSHLKVNGQRIWLSWRLARDFQQLEYRTPPQREVQPDGPIGHIYNGLISHLADSHDVIPFSYDWRLPLEEEARRLARAVEEALKAREENGQPVRLLTHSTGGLLARAMQIEAGSTWNRLMERQGARVLMLAPPNEGLWVPLQVLSGDETLGGTLGTRPGEHVWRETMACFPGFLQLQAGLLDPDRKLDRCETWKNLATADLNLVKAWSWWHQDPHQRDAFQWGVPDQQTLNQAVGFWNKLRRQRDVDLPSWRDKLAIVVGSAPFTTTGFVEGADGLLYLEADDCGDGRVTHASAVLPGVRTWICPCDHGKLPADSEAFSGYKELLETGDTTRLDVFKTPIHRPSGSDKTAGNGWRSSRPSRQHRSSAPPSQVDDLYALVQQEGEDDGLTQPLPITVHNSHLAYVTPPLMLGHYTSSKLTGTEALVDQLIGGSMGKALQIGCYPDHPGSHQVFRNRAINRANPLQTARPACAIVVGLGEEGKLSPAQLIYSVRMAVLGFAQHWKDLPEGGERPFELWTTLLGSGGSGIDAGQAAQMIAQGVRAANNQLQGTTHWPTVESLHLVELYLDRASSALHALKSLAISQSGRYSISNTVKQGEGWERRPLDMGYRGAGYDFISALTGTGSDDSSSTIHYTMNTRRARTEMRAQTSQRRMVEQLVTQASNANYSDRTIGRTLFNLLVPIEMEAALGGTSAMVLELDQGSAAIPWELLDSESVHHGGGDHKPWSIRTKLIRKLKLQDFRQQPQDASLERDILVIGEPRCQAPRLPGARKEALAVVEELSNELGPDRVVSLISPEESNDQGPSALKIINTLLERTWRIVHISGHGMLGDVADPRGVVLSDDLYLGHREIKMMRVVPELVFLNCCHLAATDPERLLVSPCNRAQFAASVAEQLIRNGVRCVVAAGWAVSDTSAEVFARRFYAELLRGQRFIDAIAAARAEVYDKAAGSDNTWAAYQCYGDPDWVLKAHGGDPQDPSFDDSDRFESVVSASALILALESLTNSARFRTLTPHDLSSPGQEGQTLRKQLEDLESRFERLWGGKGQVAEAFAAAWEQANDKAKAITWYERALKTEDGGASLKSCERLGNLRPRLAWEQVKRADAEHKTTRNTMIASARTTIVETLKELEQLMDWVGPSIERYNLCGSAMKRLALVERIAGKETNDNSHEMEALRQMREWYGKAEQKSKEKETNEGFYPILNRMAAECVLHAGNGEFDLASITEVEAMLTKKNKEDPNFWSEIGVIELKLYIALSHQNLGAEQAGIKKGYQLLYQKVKDPIQWGSVLDQLRFVLPSYCERIQSFKPIEVQAAYDLMAMLENFTQPSSATL